MFFLSPAFSGHSSRFCEFRILEETFLPVKTMNKWFFNRKEQRDQITSAEVYLIFNRDRFLWMFLYVNDTAGSSKKCSLGRYSDMLASPTLLDAILRQNNFRLSQTKSSRPRAPPFRASINFREKFSAKKSVRNIFAFISPRVKINVRR